MGILSNKQTENHLNIILETYFVTTWIFTPKTPDCFRDGIRFKLNSLLVNLIDSFTSIYIGSEKAADDDLATWKQTWVTSSELHSPRPQEISKTIDFYIRRDFL